jgi:hopanoid biosynthesis associated protein HpnK
VANADDFGLSSGINRGIKSAYCEGILRSASLMPNGPWFDHAVRIARENPGLGVGIHVSLVDESCIAPAGQLRGLATPDGCLPRSYGAFVKAFLTRKFGVAEVRTEIEAQVARVLATGIAPTHIDFHQHLHILPGVFEVVLTVAQSTGIRVVRVPLDQGRQAGSVARQVQTRILSFLCVRNAKKLAKVGIKFSHHFHGIWLSGNMNESNLLATLGRLKPGVNEVMMHPGFSDVATAARYDWAYHWDEEYAALVSKRVRSFIDEHGIRLSNFADAWLA